MAKAIHWSLSRKYSLLCNNNGMNTSLKKVTEDENIKLL